MSVYCSVMYTWSSANEAAYIANYISGMSKSSTYGNLTIWIALVTDAVNMTEIFFSVNDLKKNHFSDIYTEIIFEKAVK